MIIPPAAASAAQAVAQAAADKSGSDPVLTTVGWLGAIFAGAMMAGAPIMHYLRKWNADKAANAQDSAEANLYKTLTEQIERMNGDLKAVHEQLREVNAQHMEQLRINAELSSKAAEAERMAEKIQRMSAKLDAREQEIRELLTNHSAEREQWMGTIRGKDQIILSQEQRIRQLETSVRDLELRLIQDDRRKISAIPQGSDGLDPPLGA